MIVGCLRKLHLAHFIVHRTALQAFVLWYRVFLYDLSQIPGSQFVTGLVREERWTLLSFKVNGDVGALGCIMGLNCDNTGEHGIACRPGAPHVHHGDTSFNSARGRNGPRFPIGHWGYSRSHCHRHPTNQISRLIGDCRNIFRYQNAVEIVSVGLPPGNRIQCLLFPYLRPSLNEFHVGLRNDPYVCPCGGSRAGQSTDTHRRLHLQWWSRRLIATTGLRPGLGLLLVLTPRLYCSVHRH